MNSSGIRFLEELESVIDQRRAAPAAGSYTAQLLRDGGSRISQKVGEEAVELALAGVQQDRGQIVAEAADLLFHVMVLLRFHDVSLADVVAELQKRHR
jgi:phosphoribosyl-ATP pyrophosphohydrolase